MNMITKSKPQIVIEATIIRADGTREELGEIARTKVSLVKRIVNWTKKVFK